MKSLEWKDILTVLIGGLVGLLPIVMSSILAWFDKRSLAAKQHQALELAKNRVDFIDRWVKVQQDINSADRFEEIKRETALELDELKKGLSEILAENDEKPAPVQESAKKVLQRLLLWYWPLNFSGWISHLAFYLVLLYTIYLVIGYQPGIDPATDQFSWAQLGWDLIAVLIMFIPTLIIRGIAVRIDRKAGKDLSAPSAIEALS